MKKLLAVCACTVLSLSLSGCSLGTVLEQITSTGDVSVEEPSSPESAATEPKSRVYMDEISGTLQDFSGSQLILNKGEASYVFNLSGATLECKDGMITGDEISVIYEGQLSGTDTSTVQTLKVVDEFHRKSKLKKRTAPWAGPFPHCQYHNPEIQKRKNCYLSDHRHRTILSERNQRGGLGISAF